LNKKQLNVILMVLILLIAMPFLPLLAHKNSKQSRYDDARPDIYPGESGVESGVDDEKSWENMSEPERSDALEEWAKDLPNWLRDLVREDFGDLDADGIPNIDDPDIDGDGIPNDEDDDPAKQKKQSYDSVNIDNFYDGDNRDELERELFRITPISPARYWKVRSLEVYDRGSGGGNRWTSKEGTPSAKGPYAPPVLEYVERKQYSYNLVFEGSSNEDDYIPTAHHTTRVYNTNPAEEDAIRVSSKGDFYTRETLKSYSFDVYDYNFSTESLYSFELSTEQENALKNELKTPGYFEDTRKNESKVSELALNITKDMDSQYNKTMAIVAYLKYNYLYNFRSYPTPAGEEPIYWFLFERKDGTCVNFASAFVMLARLSDIPARLAIGFAIGTVEDDVRVVKANNAHAWGEVYFGDMGWIPFEPTSSQIADGGGNGGQNDGVDDDIQGGGDGGGSTSGDEADSDGDRIPDALELAIGTDPLHNDTDGDGLADGDERYDLKTDPTSNDTDNDGLSDYLEYIILGTDPDDQDSDEDGIGDWNEVMGFTFRLGSDDNYEWNTTTTNPREWDSDSDDLHDGLEIGLTLPQTNQTVVDSSEADYFYPDSDPTTTTHPMLTDTDGDNLTDGEEDRNKNGRYDAPSSRAFQGETDPSDPDTDGGGAWDGTEKNGGGDPTSDHDDAAYMDTDGDGLLDADEITGWNITYVNETGVEIRYHTSSNISNPDTDGDGLLDSYEINTGDSSWGDPKDPHPTHPTDPRSNDTDGDGLEDGNESWTITIYKKGGKETKHVEASPLAYNNDTDGLSDYQEWENGTNPQNDDTDGDNPPGEHILDDHLDKHPTMAAYDYIDTTITLSIEKTDVWKVTEEMKVDGVVNGTKNREGNITVVSPSNLSDVRIKLYLADSESDLSNLSNVTRTTIASLKTDSAAEFIFYTDFEDIKVGIYTLWAEVLTTYGSFEQYNTSVSNFIGITISTETELTMDAPVTVADEGDLYVTARLLDKGGLTLPVKNLTVTFSWKEDGYINTTTVNDGGRAYFQHYIEEETGEYYSIKVEFSGHMGSYYSIPDGRWLNYTINQTLTSVDVKVLSSNITMSVAIPGIVPVNQSFEAHGNITARAKNETVDLTGETIQARFHNKLIGEGTVLNDSSFSIVCTLDVEDTRPGYTTITFLFPGTNELAEHRELHSLNVAGLSGLEITAPGVVERPENITIEGTLTDNRGDVIPGREVEIQCKGIDANNSSAITDEEGEFTFHLAIPKTHALGHLPVTVCYKGYGYYGENESNKEKTVTNYFPAVWSGSIKVMATVDIFMNRTVFVRAEANSITLRMESYGNDSIVQDQPLYLYFRDELMKELRTDAEGVVETEFVIPAEEEPGRAGISVEFPGTEFIKGRELDTTVSVFTRTRVLMNSSSHFRPLERDSPLTIKGQVENTTRPLRSIKVSLYISNDVVQSHEVLAAYQEHESGKLPVNPFVDPISAGRLSFPEHFSFIEDVYTDYYGNFSRTVSIKEKAGTGRFFIYALFNGTEFYYPAREIIFIDIMANSTLLFGASTTPVIGKEMGLTLTLLDDLFVPLSGKAVSVTYVPSEDDEFEEPGSGILETAISDANGSLSFSPLIPVELAKGERSFKIVFSGDMFYSSSRYTVPVVIYMESHLQIRFFDGKNRIVLPKQILEEQRSGQKGEQGNTTTGNATATLKGRSYIREGEKLRCEIRLLDIYDNPIPYKKIDIHLNGDYYKSGYLDENASYSFDLTVDHGVSGYLILQAVYRGGSDVAGNSTRMDVEVKGREEQGFFTSSVAALSLLAAVVVVAVGAFYLLAFKQEEEIIPEEIDEEKQESNRRLIIKEYNRFVEFMRYYGYDLGPSKTAREIIKESDKSILITEEDLSRITEIFERARYNKLSTRTEISGTSSQDGEGEKSDTHELWPADKDVEEIQRLIRKIEDDIEVESIPLRTGEEKLTDGIFDGMKSIHEKVSGLMNGREK